MEKGRGTIAKILVKTPWKDLQVRAVIISQLAIIFDERLKLDR